MATAEKRLDAEFEAARRQDRERGEALRPVQDLLARLLPGAAARRRRLEELDAECASHRVEPPETGAESGRIFSA
jgi:hypothetical protein